MKEPGRKPSNKSRKKKNITKRPPNKKISPDKLSSRAEFWLRLVYGIALYAMACGSILYGGSYLFGALLIALSFLIYREWLLLITPDPMGENLFASSIIGLVYFIFVVLISSQILMNHFVIELVVYTITGISYLVAIASIHNYDPKNQNLIFLTDPLMARVVALLFIGIFLFFSVSIYMVSPVYSMVALSLACAFDTGGYIVGRDLKGRKLSPISPQKTLSGLIGGIVFVLLAYYGLTLIFELPPLSFISIFFLLLLAGFVQYGDLFQSIFKRHANVKNSGDFIPGHGGVFDRTDGLLWSSFPFYCFLQFVQ